MPSNRRLKSNIRQLPTSLEAMMKLDELTMNDNPGQTEYGFIAQDVERILPSLVVAGNDPSRTLSLNYIVRAIQEMKVAGDARMEAIEKENRDLRALLKAAGIDNCVGLRKEVEAMKKAVGAGGRLGLGLGFG